MHYLMMISNKSDMLFRTELLMRSIKYFSTGQKIAFSIVINGNDKSPFNGLKLTKGTISNKYILQNADIFDCPYHWETPVPSRWFIEPKMEMCVFIDVDMIACNNLEPLYNLENNVLHGITAYNTHMPKAQWDSLNFNSSDLKYYFNFGMLVVPSKFVLSIGNKMLDNALKIYDKFIEFRYFAGQIALACTLKELKIPLSILPNKFNWHDRLPPKNIEEIIFLHYTSSQNFITNKFTALSASKSENIYMKTIGKITRKVYLPI